MPRPVAGIQDRGGQSEHGRLPRWIRTVRDRRDYRVDELPRHSASRRLRFIAAHAARRKPGSTHARSFDLGEDTIEHDIPCPNCRNYPQPCSPTGKLEQTERCGPHVVLSCNLAVRELTPPHAGTPPERRSAARHRIGAVRARASAERTLYRRLACDWLAFANARSATRFVVDEEKRDHPFAPNPRSRHSPSVRDPDRAVSGPGSSQPAKAVRPIDIHAPPALLLQYSGGSPCWKGLL